MVRIFFATHGQVHLGYDQNLRFSGGTASPTGKGGNCEKEGHEPAHPSKQGETHPPNLAGRSTHAREDRKIGARGGPGGGFKSKRGRRQSTTEDADLIS